MKAPLNALVTGAARGIGLAAVRLLLKEGWQVALLDRDADALHEAAATLGDNVRVLVCDISDEDAVSALAAAWEGPLNALVNNAGVADFGPIEETDFQRWRRVMATNLDGTFLMSQAFTPALKLGAAEGLASICNVASISGLRASTLRVAYGTSKAAVVHLTQQQAVELGEYGVRANAVAPGPVDTKLALAVHTPAIRAAYHDAIPLNRYGQENEIAEAIRFLVSPRASYVTGQLLCADGGFEATGIGLPSLRG